MRDPYHRLLDAHKEALARVQALEVDLHTADCMLEGVREQLATLTSRVQALEGALRDVLDDIQAGPLNDLGYGNFYRPDICQRDIRTWECLLAMSAPPNAPAGESVRTDTELLDYFSNPNRRLIGYVEPYWYVFKQADTEVDSKHTDIRDAINAAMELTTTETSNAHDED